MKKILMSLFLIGVVTIVAVMATGAFFSDEEKSLGNTFVAGAIDLKIDNTSYGFDWNDPNNTSPNGTWGLNSVNSWQSTDLTNQKFFSFSDLKPGDYGEDTISLVVQDNDAWACMAFDLTATPENTWTSPEQEFGDPGTESGDDGELQDYLSFLFWNDDGDNVLETGETVIQELSGLPGSIFTGGWLAIADSGDDPLVGGTTNYIGKGWCFGTMTATPVAQDGVNTNPPAAPARVGFTCDGTGNQNDAQTDGIVVDVAFHAVQSRNNEQFLCSSLPPVGGGEQRQLVGAALTGYTQPEGEACDVTVTDGGAEPNTIAEGIALANPTETVCVEAGTYNEDVNVNKSITLSGDGATATSTIIGQTPGFGGAVAISANDVILEGFQITGAGGSVFDTAVYITGVRNNVTVRYNHITTGVGGGNALLTDGGQSNHTISNNIFDGAAAQLVYVNGFADVGTASTNVDFTNNDFNGSATGPLLGTNATSSLISLNDFNGSAGSNDFGTFEDTNVVNYNNFTSSATIKVGNSDSGTLDAQFNWWGDTDPSDNVSGLVDFDPFELSAYPEN